MDNYSFLLKQERKQKELERKLDDPPPTGTRPTDNQQKIDDETDDEKDELEEDIVVTRL